MQCVVAILSLGWQARQGKGGVRVIRRAIERCRASIGERHRHDMQYCSNGPRFVSGAKAKDSVGGMIIVSRCAYDSPASLSRNPGPAGDPANHEMDHML